MKYNSKYMIATTQIAKPKIFVFKAVLVFMLMNSTVLFINRKDNRHYLKVGHFFKKIAN